MAEAFRLRARGAFEGVLASVEPKHDVFVTQLDDARPDSLMERDVATSGVLVTPRYDIQIATLIARDGGVLAWKARGAIGSKLPASPKRSVFGDICFLGLGPRTWLAIAKADSPTLANRLRLAFGDSAAVTDQSDGYAILRIAGEKARSTFEKGLAVDLHPHVFGPGDVASTTCAHINVIIWQIDEGPTYEVAIFRSYAASFCRWLAESAAEYGLKVGQLEGD